MKCEICGKELPKFKRKYCSEKCYHISNKPQTEYRKQNGLQKRRTKKVKKEKVPYIDTLEVKLKEAKELGVSYGKLKAMEYANSLRKETL